MWETIYRLKLKYAQTFIPIALATGNKSALLQTAYGTQDLREWALERVNLLIKEAIAVRAGRDISEESLAGRKGYRGLWSMQIYGRMLEDESLYRMSALETDK